MAEKKPTKKESILDKRNEQIKRVRELKNKLQDIGIEASLSEIGADFDNYMDMVNAKPEERENPTEEQKELIKKVDNYYDLLLKGTDEVFYDYSITKKSVIKNEVVEFVLAIVPAKLIGTATRVAKENKRNQDSLNEHNLHYILKTLRDDGQYMEAEGFLSPEDGKIVIVDGSSRSVSCFLAERPFKIFVALKQVEVFDSETIEQRSEVANDHKSISFWEIGKDLSNLKSKTNFSAAKIAEMRNLSAPRVSTLLGAVDEVPYSLYEYFDSITSVSRPIVEKLVPMWRGLAKENATDKFLEQLGDKTDYSGLSDDQVFKQMQAISKALLTPNTDRRSSYTDKGAFRVKQKFDAKKGTASINIIDASPDIIEKLQKFLDESL